MKISFVFEMISETFLTPKWTNPHIQDAEPADVWLMISVIISVTNGFMFISSVRIWVKNNKKKRENKRSKVTSKNIKSYTHTHTHTHTHTYRQTDRESHAEGGGSHVVLLIPLAHTRSARTHTHTQLTQHITVSARCLRPNSHQRCYYREGMCVCRVCVGRTFDRGNLQFKASLSLSLSLSHSQTHTHLEIVRCTEELEITAAVSQSAAESDSTLTHSWRSNTHTHTHTHTHAHTGFKCKGCFL